MISHIRACLFLLVATVLLCSVAYPAALLGIGQTLFRPQAQGSIVMGGDKAIGSRLIAQPFTGDEYFQPRPSAVSYNASASGGSNWAASNYQLRDRVARALGPIVKYRGGPKAGQLVGADVEAWFQQKPGLVKEWAQAHSTLAQNWVKADDLNKAYVAAWMNDNRGAVAEWVKANPGTPTPNPDDVAVPFFASYSDRHPGTFPSIVEEKPATGASTKSIQPKKDGIDIQSIFFDTWRQEHADADLEEVPADLVMASGSGLDPHITLAGARFQLDRVVAARAEKSKQNKEAVRAIVEKVLADHTEAPLGGLAGVPLVNVFEVNLALDQQPSGGR